MTGLEILDHVAYGHTLFHRDRDAWDLLAVDGRVVAVLCPRTAHLSIAPVGPPSEPVPTGRRIPYGEKVALKITESTLQDGVDALRKLTSAQRA